MSEDKIETAEAILGEPGKTPPDHRLVKIDDKGRLVVPNDVRVVREDGVDAIPMIRHVMGVIEGPPAAQETLYSQACANDEITISSWREQWMRQLTANAKKYDFSALSAMAEFRKELYKPVIIAGSGPSLKKNAHELKKREGLKIVSCLHNFGFFEDLGVMGPEDYYITLDAGEITIEEVYNGGKRPEDDYWAISKDRTLIAHACTHPKLLEKWQGKVLFYATPSRPDLQKEFDQYIDFTKVPPFNTGGNALGACMYMAKAILGCGTLIFVGADFCFDYTHKFHSWDSSYDKKFSGVVPCVDIFGNRVFTWQSYYNFKSWFDYMSVGGRGGNPTQWINCTEGGILGAYAQGCIRQIWQLDLNNALYLYNMNKRLPELMAKKDEPVLLF